MPRSWRWSRALAAAIVTLAVLGAATLAPRLTVRPERVEDGAGLFSPAESRRLAEYHGFLLADHGIDYRVVTAAGTGDINAFAVARFERIAEAGRNGRGRGLLLVIDPEQDLVRLEVGYALEGEFPDAFVAYVEQRQMVEFFAAGRVADGVLAATELIVTRAQRAAATAGFEGELWLDGSGGAGATTPARIGAGVAPVAGRPGARPPAGPTPAETLGRYFAAMQERNADPELAIYTAETRRMLREWVVTPAQMDNVVKIYRRCRAEPARIAPGGERAVIRYPVGARECAPWFFRRAGDGWALDLTMMQTAIRFGRGNAWRFEPGAEHGYRFAFEDWRFDRRGFPVE